MTEQALKSAKVVPRDIALNAVNLENYQRFRQRQACIQQAQSKPLPGATEKAFTSGAVRAGGHVVHRVVPARFAVLQALDSPLLKMIQNAMTKQKTDAEFTPEQQWEICHVFTTDAKALYRNLRENGPEFIRQQSYDIGIEWEAGAVNVVMLAVMEQIKRHIETTVKFASDMQKEGQVSFFQNLPENP